VIHKQQHILNTDQSHANFLYYLV